MGAWSFPTKLNNCMHKLITRREIDSGVTHRVTWNLSRMESYRGIIPYNNTSHPSNKKLDTL